MGDLVSVDQKLGVSESRFDWEWRRQKRIDLGLGMLVLSHIAIEGAEEEAEVGE